MACGRYYIILYLLCVMAWRCIFLHGMYGIRWPVHGDRVVTVMVIDVVVLLLTWWWWRHDGVDDNALWWRWWCQRCSRTVVRADLFLFVQVTMVHGTSFCWRTWCASTSFSSLFFYNAPFLSSLLPFSIFLLPTLPFARPRPFFYVVPCIVWCNGRKESIVFYYLLYKILLLQYYFCMYSMLWYVYGMVWLWYGMVIWRMVQ